MENDNDTEWMVSAGAYLARLGRAEYEAQRSWHKGNPKRFRFVPSDYMRDLIKCMDRNDEEGFKARKMLEGYSSEIGV